jgi:hypothetical protein
MVGIGRMARFGRRKHQPVATQQPIKTVTAGHHHIRIIQAAEHNPKLITTYAWILCTDFLHTLQNSPIVDSIEARYKLGKVRNLAGTIRSAYKRDLGINVDLRKKQSEELDLFGNQI